MVELSSNEQQFNEQQGGLRGAPANPYAYDYHGGGGQVQKVWRIGTYSMGITLIGIGLAFAASLWQTVTSYELLLWLAPIVFIVLGVELMLAHTNKFANQYKVVYNWLSVFFVGCVGAGALLLSAFLSSGVLDEVNGLFSVKERSVYIEEKIQLSDPAIDKIVIKSDVSYEVQKQAGLNEISLLGLIHYESEEPAKLTEQIMKSKQVGSVLYLFIQNIDYDNNTFSPSYTRSQLILNVPESLAVQ